MEERKPLPGRTNYSRIKDVSSRQLAVNVIAAVDKQSFRPYASNNRNIVGEVHIGDSSGSMVLILRGHHNFIIESTDSVFSFKNVSPNIVHGRLQVELNEFSQVAPMKSGGHFSVNKANDLSSISFDPYAS